MRRALVVLAAAGCGAVPPGPSAPADRPAGADAGVAAAVPDGGLPELMPPPLAPRPPRQDIEVRYRARADTWAVQWTFTEPTTGLVFDRRQPRIRHAGWLPGPGLRWSIEGPDEVLRPIDGVARTHFSVGFATDDTSHQRAPPLNLRWRDGSRLLYTGALGAHALACRAGEPLDRCPRRDVGGPRAWRFVADDDRGFRILDAASPGALDWAEPAGDLRGTYVYAGRAAATEAAVVTTVADAGLPPWLATETARRLPALLADLGARTGLPLPWKPLVLVSRGAGPAHLRALRGRTLPNLVQLEARGGRWDRKTRGAEQAWLELLAHESFHLWNGQLARRADVLDEWWSEGASSFVAGRALREAGLLDARRYQRRIRRTAAACLASLRGPLRAEAADPSYYTCGELVHFVVDAHLGATGGIDPIYAALFAEAQTRGSYSTAGFVALLTSRGAPAGVVADVEQLTQVGLGVAPAAFVARLLTEAGLPTRVVPGRGRRPARLAAATVPPPRRSPSRTVPASRSPRNRGTVAP